MSCLDDPRVLFAAERTLLPWQRTAIALIGLGFVGERVGLVSLSLGVGLLAIGSGLSTVSALQYRSVLRTLVDQEVPRGHRGQPGPLGQRPAGGCGTRAGRARRHPQ
jgi:putative membrane protein